MTLDPGVLHDADTRLLRLGGPDAAAYLQAVTTQDLAPLRAGEARFAALADDRGHWRGDFWVWRTEDDWLLEVGAERAPELAERLERFAITEDVTFEPIAAPGLHWEGVATRNFAAGIDGARVLPRSLYGEPGATVFAAAADVARVRAAALAAGFEEIGEGERTRLRIEAGRPRGGVDVTEDDLLPEAGWWAAISLEKGCFPGQEIIRRVAARGRLRRRIAGVRFDRGAGEGLAGAAVHPACGPAAGRVTSAALVPGRDESVALAWMAMESAVPGTSVVAIGGAGEISGRVVALPMRRGGAPAAADAVAEEVFA